MPDPVKVLRPEALAAAIIATQTAADQANQATSDVLASAAVIEQAGGVGRVANEAALSGQPAGNYELIATNERVNWNGSTITARGPMLATVEQVAQPAIGSVSQGRGVIYRGGTGYLPAPADAVADGIYTIDEGGKKFSRASLGVMPWEFDAFPGTADTERNAGAQLQAWMQAAPRGSTLHLPRGYWYTDQTLAPQAAELEIKGRGILRPAGTFSDYLFKYDGKGFSSAERGAAWGDDPYNGHTGGNIWQPSNQAIRLILDGLHQAKGAYIASIDHYDLQLYARRIRGASLFMSLCREGDAKIYVVHSEADAEGEDVNDPLVANIRIQDSNEGDANNSMTFSATQVVFSYGKSLSIDSPLFDPANPTARPNYPDVARFITFHSPHFETVRGDWQFGPRKRTHWKGPEVYIGRASGVTFLGGMYGAPAFQLGDSAKNYSATGVQIIGGEFYGGETSVSTIDAQQGSYTVQGAFWRTNTDAPKITEGANMTRLEQYGGVQYGADGGKPAVSLRNRGGNANAAPVYETQTGITAYAGSGPGVVRYGGDLDAEGFPRVSLLPNYGSGEDNATFVDRKSRLYGQKAVQLGRTGSEAQGVVFKAFAAAPNPDAGLVCLADGKNWNPLGKSTTTPYLVRWDGSAWVAVS